MGPPDSIFTPTGDTRAPVPIARLIDTDTFGGGNFDVLTLTSIGVAEYTNGNFLSDDTIFSDFALPRRSSLNPESFADPGDPTRYFEKVGEGQQIRHFVAESTLYNPVKEQLGQPMDQAFILTRRVYEDYAAELLPRAVGYSASLLNYFFRGTLSFTVSAGGPGGQSILKITNTSSETMEGKFTLYADNSSDVRSKVDSFDPLILGPGASSTQLPFTAPGEVKAYILVFEGKLVNVQTGAVEEGAVVGKVQGCSFATILSGGEALLSGAPSSVSKPSGTTEGDLLLAFVYVNTESVVPSISDGWTLLEFSTATPNIIMHVFWKLAGSSEPATYIITSDDPDFTSIGATVYRISPHASSPIHNSDITSLSGPGTPTTPSITISETCTAIVAVAILRGEGMTTFDPPSGFTTGGHSVGGDLFYSAGILNQASTGNLGPQSFVAVFSDIEASITAIIVIK